MDDALGDLIATLGSVDHEAIDWANVLRTTVLIHQHFRYEYPGPIAELRQRLMVVPPDFHDGQRLVTHKIRVSGCNVDIERSYDTFGNVILDFSVQEVEKIVEFTAWIVVEREASVDGSDDPDPLPPDARLCEPSRLTEPDDALELVAADLRDTGLTGAELAERDLGTRPRPLHLPLRPDDGRQHRRRGVGRRPRRVPGLRALHARPLPAVRPAGALRLRAPARRGRHPRLGGGARAAPDGGGRAAGRAIDPTHDRRAGLKYLSVAVGRDYADVPPTSGTFEAPYAGQLTTHKRAAVTRVEYLRPRRRRRGRTPVQ